MLRRPPISTRTHTLFPYTTLFRSEVIADALEALFHILQCQPSPTSDPAYIAPAPCRIVCEVFTVEPFGADRIAVLILMRDPENARSEERRVGKECVSTCRYRWSPYH